MPKLDRLASQRKNAGNAMVPYPYANCTVQLERLDPEMLKVQLQKLDPAMPQTQKKEVSRRIWKHTEKHRKSNNAYNKRKLDGFNLLKKWVPGTKTLSHPDILKKTVNYIKELLNKVNEKELLKESKKRVNYIEELEKKIKELETPQREPHPSEPEIVLDPTGASTSMNVTTTIPEWVTLDEVGSPDEELLANLEEELLASGEELTELNSMEDFTKWLEL
jgi:hypothetical protein